MGAWLSGPCLPQPTGVSATQAGPEAVPTASPLQGTSQDVVLHSSLPSSTQKGAAEVPSLTDRRG